MSDDIPIHLRTPAATKARWVRASRAEGKRLGDWIIERVEASMQAPRITIPPGLKFSALKLARDPLTGDVSFDTAIINRIEAASGLPGGYFMGAPEDALSSLIVQWYTAHREAGGAADATAEDLLSEVRAEDERGGGLSHQPGRA